MLPPKELLKKIQPFSSMSEDELSIIISGLQVASFKKNMTIYDQGAKNIPVYVVFSGLVCLYRNEEVIDYASRGELFGVSAVLDNTRTPLGAKALEDSVCYSIRRDDFRNVLARNPGVADFFRSFLSRKFKTFTQLTRRPQIVEEGAFALDIGQLVFKKPVTCAPDTSVEYAAKAMDANRVGSIVAVDGNGKPLGILTSKDLRRVIIRGSKSDPISRFMSSPAISIEADTPVFNAYSAMMESEIDHLVVQKEGAVQGVVTSKDILTQLAPSFSILTFYRKILKASGVEELKAAFTGLKMAVAGMALKDLSFYDLSRIITSVNDTIVKEALQFAGCEHAPGDFLWFHMGSSGRREQVIATDQDNAIVCRGEPPRKFAESVSAILEEIGIPRCAAGYMACNERWNGGMELWKSYFKTWFAEAKPENLRFLSVFLDIRPIYGDRGLYEELLGYVQESVTNQSIRFLAYDAGNAKIPIGIFGIKNLEQGVNLKECGIYPIANGIRVMALENRVLEIVNTKDRIDALNAMGVLSDPMRSDLLECYEFLQGLRLKHQSRAIMENKAADNKITSRELDKMDLLVLKESLKISSSFVNFLRARYGVERGL